MIDENAHQVEVHQPPSVTIYGPDLVEGESARIPVAKDLNSHERMRPAFILGPSISSITHRCDLHV